MDNVVKSAPEPTTPNLFRWATSELSQDAVLCWLLAWAEIDHAESGKILHKLGASFIELIYKLAKKEIPISYSSVDIRRQLKGIDILCIINADTTIIIEDKTASEQHSGQLERYQSEVKKLGYSEETIICVYVQTGDQSDYSVVKKAGYVIITRADLLRLFESDIGIAAGKESDIIRDFTTHLRRREDAVNSYKHLPFEKWVGAPWAGFYTRLQDELTGSGWSYIPNQSGGFLGFYWGFLSNAVFEVHLQLKQDKFHFKIRVENKSKRRELRDLWSQAIRKSCEEQGLGAIRPRYADGEYMTAAELTDDYRGKNDQSMLDLHMTIENLRKVESIHKKCFEEFASLQK